MREISTKEIINAVAQLCIDANCFLNEDITLALKKGVTSETSPQGREILRQLIDNADIARNKQVPICQDTGMAIIFADIGQDVHITGGSLTDAINEGVRQGYKDGFLRKSVVSDPLRRENTGDNTPAVIHYNIVNGNKIKLTIMPKGFGSENMSGVKMLKPSQGYSGVVDFVTELAEKAGSNPCPPIVVGVGIGGSMEKAALLSKQALSRPLSSRNSDEFYASMEDEILNKINKSGIGPQGLGGNTTALGVNIETYPTHIAGLPVAVTISCHVTRHREIVL